MTLNGVLFKTKGDLPLDEQHSIAYKFVEKLTPGSYEDNNTGTIFLSSPEVLYDADNGEFMLDIGGAQISSLNDIPSEIKDLTSLNLSFCRKLQLLDGIQPRSGSSGGG